MKVDVTREDQVIIAAQGSFEALGRIDIVVNNAGIVRDIPVIPITLDEWNRIIAVDLTGSFLCSKAVVPYMQRSGRGKIINMSSALPFTAARSGSITSVRRQGRSGLRVASP
jgi:3-oxoacyl-[acyl-carrier protein] reductase